MFSKYRKRLDQKKRTIFMFYMIILSRHTHIIRILCICTDDLLVCPFLHKYIHVR